jgi:hypothetical protein
MTTHQEPSENTRAAVQVLTPTPLPRQTSAAAADGKRVQPPLFGQPRVPSPPRSAAAMPEVHAAYVREYAIHSIFDCHHRCLYAATSADPTAGDQ